jgi:hypothetical protein
MTFLANGGEGGSYSSKPSLSAQHQPYIEEGSVLQILSVVLGKKSLEEDKEKCLCCKNIFYVLTLWQNRPLIWVTSPDVTDSREKRNQGQFDFLRQKIW